MVFVFANPTEEKGERLCHRVSARKAQATARPSCATKNGELIKRNIALIIQQRILSLSLFFWI